MGPARGIIAVRRLLLLLGGLALAMLPLGAAMAHESPQRGGGASESEGAPQSEAAPQGQANSQSYEALYDLHPMDPARERIA